METARAMRLRRWLIGLAVVLTLPMVAWAQAAPRVYWEHDGVDLTTFQCQIDAVDPVDLTGLYTLDTGTTYYTALSNCGTLTAGAHQVYIYACHGTTCTPSAAITVVKL